MKLDTPFVIRLAAAAALLPSLVAAQEAAAPTISIETDMASPSMAAFLDRIIALNPQPKVDINMKRSFWSNIFGGSDDDTVTVDNDAAFESVIAAAPTDTPAKRDHHPDHDEEHDPDHGHNYLPNQSQGAHNATVDLSQGASGNNHTYHARAHDEVHTKSHRNRFQVRQAKVGKDGSKFAKAGKGGPPVASATSSAVSAASPVVVAAQGAVVASVAPQANLSTSLSVAQPTLSTSLSVTKASLPTTVSVATPTITVTGIPVGGFKIVTNPADWTLMGGYSTPATGNTGIARRQEAVLVEELQELASSEAAAAASPTEDADSSSPLPVITPGGIVQIVSDPSDLTLVGLSAATPDAMAGVVRKRTGNQGKAMAAPPAQPSASTSAAHTSVAPIKVVADTPQNRVMPGLVNPTPNAMIGIVKKRASNQGKAMPAPPAQSPASSAVTRSSAVPVKVVVDAPQNRVMPGLNPTPNAMVGIVKRQAKSGKAAPAPVQQGDKSSSSAAPASVAPQPSSKTPASGPSPIPAVVAGANQPAVMLKPTPNAMVGIVRRSDADESEDCDDAIDAAERDEQEDDSGVPFDYSNGDDEEGDHQDSIFLNRNVRKRAFVAPLPVPTASGFVKAFNGKSSASSKPENVVSGAATAKPQPDADHAWYDRVWGANQPADAP